jgi:signal recognition particle receptor subunit beta
MPALKTLLIEREKNVVEKFKRASGKAIQIEHINNTSELNSLISNNNKFDVICTSADNLLKQNDLRQLLRSRQYPILVYTTLNESAQRIQLYDLGVWFTWNINSGVDPFYQQMQLLIQQRKNVEQIRQKADLMGNIKNISFADMMTNLSHNRQTAELVFYSRFGKIVTVFDNGHLKYARQGGLTGNAAILNLFLWPSGSFFLYKTDPEGYASNVTASVVALIFEGQRRQNIFWSEWVKKLQFNSPIMLKETQFKQVPKKVKRLSHFFNGNHTLIEVLLGQELDAWSALHDVEKLIHNGQLGYLIEQEGEVINNDLPDYKKFFGIKETERLEALLFGNKPGLKEGKFVIAGTKNSGVTSVIRKLSGKQATPLKKVQNLIFTRIALEKKSVALFGITLEVHFTEILKKLSDNLLGLILLIDARNKPELEYTSYLMHSLFHQFPKIQFAIGLTHSEKAKALPYHVVLDDLKLPSFSKLKVCNLDDDNSIKELVFSLKEIPVKFMTDGEVKK